MGFGRRVKKLLLFATLANQSFAESAINLNPDSAEARISRAGSSFSLEIDDPGNHSWMVQKSTTLNDGGWTNLSAHRVFNGHLSIRIPIDGSVHFYRLNSDETTDQASSTIDALVQPASPHVYEPAPLPPHLLTPQIAGQDNTPLTNPTTNEGAALGRVLFHDKRLSANQTISCASCHQAEHGFSDPARFSIGFEGERTARNSMGLTNARFYLRQSFFWDERAATLEEQVLQPIQDEVEMGMNLDELIIRLSAETFYEELFETAFGDSEITRERIAKALAQFVRSIASGNSRFDEGVPVNFRNFTAQENLGRAIFQGAQGGCAACHGSDNLVPGNLIFNNGLENPYIDKGVGEHTGRAADEGFFKVPSLRNIALTAPYMHDGRFATLEDVVNFYNTGVVDHPNLSPQLRRQPGPPGSPPPPPRRLNLSEQEKAALVAFLKTLTDTSITDDPKFSDPFRYTAE